MKKNPYSFKIHFPITVIFLLSILAITTWLVWPLIQSSKTSSSQPQELQLPLDQTAIVLPSFKISPTPEIIQPTTDILPVVSYNQNGMLILSLRDGNYLHLFAYHPQWLPLTRLTNGAWDDIDPAVSPDGKKIAFASKRNGYWNLYVLDLENNQLNQISDSFEYKGHPGWSPDGQWLVCESYLDNNLEVVIYSYSDPSQAIIRLTNDPSADFSPVWAPGGREIAFVSDRSGDMEIWSAHLDQDQNRFDNVSHSPLSQERHPGWSPDGKYLSWASSTSTDNQIVIADLNAPQKTIIDLGPGDDPIWDSSSGFIFTGIDMPNETLLGGYSIQNGSLAFPFSPLPGSIQGITWISQSIETLIQAFQAAGNPIESAPLWQPVLTIFPSAPNGRFGVVPLENISAPYPYLHDAVDEAFMGLRQETALEVNWNFLDSLENAFIPLTEPPSPGMAKNWLYTGRAFSVNPMSLYAGWMIVVKENIQGEVFWRVYLKARYQDGSEGKPLAERPWDLSARFNGDPDSYENGGIPSAVPQGYWVDFTEIARRYGWQRLPALSNWRTYYSATLFNTFIMNDGLDWDSAMAELYPSEALATVTRIPSLTPTRTDVPENYETPTPTLLDLPTNTPTPNPTFTPSP